MRVLRRQADNIVQLLSFGLVAVVVIGVRRDLLGLLIGAPAAVVAVRAFRNGLYVDDQAVTVRNTFRTVRLPRSEVERADLGRAGTAPMPVVVVKRRGGEPVPLWCLQPRGRGRKGQEAAVRVLADVQKTLAL
jgi:hypothetical protein